MKNSFNVFILLLLSTMTNAQPFKWKTLNSGTTKNINDFYFKNSEVGYIVGDNYLFKKTTDGGETWTDLPSTKIGEKPGNNGKIVGIDFHKSTSFSQLDSGIFLTWENGYHGIITSNDGSTYTSFGYMDSNLFCTIKGFSALPENKGNGYVNIYTYGQNCFGHPVHYNYYDGPFSFAYVDSVSSTKPASFTSVDRDSLFTIFGSSDGHVWRYQWVSAQPDSFYLDSTGVTAIGYASNYTWYAATNAGIKNMYVSRDSGKTFVKDTTFPATFHYPIMNDISFTSPNKGIVAATSNGRNGAIIVKDSINWYFLTTQAPLKVAKLFDDGTAYVAGENGLIMKSGRSDSVVVDNIEQPGISNFSIFPNPANDYLNVHTTNNEDNLTLKIADINGLTVLETQLKTDETNIDVRSFKKGVYLMYLSNQSTTNIKRLVVQ